MLLYFDFHWLKILGCPYEDQANTAYLFGLGSFLYSPHDHLLERSVFFVIAIIIVLEHAF
jgi:hypothetical protein